MACILYANTTSILDRTNGAARSLFTMLASLAELGHDVHVLTCTTSSSQFDFDQVQATIKRARENGSGTVSGDRAILDMAGFRYDLVRTASWRRRFVRADEQERLYRRAIELMETLRPDVYLSWGNLMTETVLFREAAARGIRTIFYLANPSYIATEAHALMSCDLVITDTDATRQLYRRMLGIDPVVVGKFVEPPENLPGMAQRDELLLVNPAPEKGVELFAALVAEFDVHPLGLVYACVESRGPLRVALDALSIPHRPQHDAVRSKAATADVDELLARAKVVLLPSIWQESGSRLIVEAHLRGIPVVAYDTGGSRELIGSAEDDLIPPPGLEMTDRFPRIVDLDLTPWVERLTRLCGDEATYEDHCARLADQARGVQSRTNRAQQLEVFGTVG